MCLDKGYDFPEGANALARNHQRHADSVSGQSAQLLWRLFPCH